MSSLGDLDCFVQRGARSISHFSSPRGMITDLLSSASSGYDEHESGYGHSSGEGGYGHSDGGYSSSYHECCPLVVDPKTLLTLLSLGAAAVYLLQ